jgi:hypothetical protein
MIVGYASSSPCVEKTRRSILIALLIVFEHASGYRSRCLVFIVEASRIIVSEYPAAQKRADANLLYATLITRYSDGLLSLSSCVVSLLNDPLPALCL